MSEFAKGLQPGGDPHCVDLLWDRVLPFYEALGAPVGAVLTDNGREFCGRPEKHPYELLLALEDIEHRTTKVRSPRTNGFVERMNRTLLEECFRVAGRTTWYERIDEIQDDLDRFLAYYNLERSHQGYRLRGKTPAQALREALAAEQLPLLTYSCPTEDDAIDHPEAAWPPPQKTGAGTCPTLYIPRNSAQLLPPLPRVEPPSLRSAVRSPSLRRRLANAIETASY
jgi:hypothetical protein